MIVDLLLVGFSDAIWQTRPVSRPLSQIALDARGAARRLAKGIDVSREVKRFHKLHSWLETSALVLRQLADVDITLVGARGEVDTYLGWLDKMDRSEIPNTMSSSYQDSVFSTFRFPSEIPAFTILLKSQTSCSLDASQKSLFDRVVTMLSHCEANSLAMVSILHVVPSSISQLEAGMADAADE